jgi:hypothetical protein
METALVAGRPLAKIAAELGYANENSAYVMLHRWGLNHLYANSFAARALARKVSKCPTPSTT